MPLPRSFAIATIGLSVALALASPARAQSPWNLTIHPSTPTLQTGLCTPIRLELLDASGKESPRNPNGARIGIADFDWSVAAGGKVVGRYDGASAWSVCACPASEGTVATITATYPAQALPQKAKTPGVAFQASITVPVEKFPSSGIPIGCEKLKTTTGATGSVPPWIVTLTPGSQAITIGNCSPMYIDLRDASTKERPRNPAGQLISLADFDLTVTPAGATAGKYDGAGYWSVCACQAGSVGTLAKVTATYPARSLPEPARVPGMMLQSSMSVPLATPQSKNNPPACIAPTTVVAVPPRAAGAPGLPVPPPPIPGAPAPMPAAPAPTPITTPAPMPAAPLPAPPPAPLPAPLPAPMPAAPAPAPVPLTPSPIPSAPVPLPAPTPTPATTLPAPLPTASPTPVTVAPTTPRAGDTPLSVSLPPGPAPTGVSVTGNQASATLTWQPVAGVASFVVSRQQAGAAAVEQTLSAANTGMYDSGLQPGTAYTWTVTAVQADGRKGSANAAFKTPAAVNPTGLNARQTGDGKVKLMWQPEPSASYYVVFGPGAQGGTRVDSALSYTVTGVPAGAQEWAVASYYDPGNASTPAAEFPRVKLTVNTFVLSGWVDLHTHPMVNLAFGGKLIHGGVDVGSLLPTDIHCNAQVRATSMADALSDDRPSHAGWNALSFPCGDNFRQLLIHEFQKSNEAWTTASPANGWPNFDQWPKWDDISHQKMWFEWIRRARDGGLRVMVALATNNKTLADAMSGGSVVSGAADGATDDQSSGYLQLREMKAFVGRHNDFMEVAYGSADIKRIVQSNRIAVVLGVEIDNIGNFNKSAIQTLPPAAAEIMINTEIQALYDSGARYIFPIHVLDNVFGGTAIYMGGFNTSNLREAGHYWDIECANTSDDINHKYVVDSDPLDNIMHDVVSMVKLGMDPLRHPGIPPVCPDGPGKSTGHRNARGLSPLGVMALKAMWKRGMIVDIDHMSTKSADATLTLAESFGMPVASGHTGIRGLAGADAENSRTRRQMERLSKLRGIFGLGTDAAYPTSWSSSYQQAMINMGYLATDTTNTSYMNGAVVLGTDLNGLVKGPRPGGVNRILYDSTFRLSTTMNKSWDYNIDGVVHYGMLADFVRAVRTTPSNGYMFGGVQRGVAGDELVDNHLMRGANYFWQMWQRIEAQKAGVH